MRVRTANPHNEAHGQNLTVLELIAPAGINVTNLPAALETALAGVGVKLYHRGDNQQNGFINTSVRPDGSVYVAIHLYQQGCAAPNCPAGHGSVVISAAPALTAAHRAALVAAIGEVAGKVLSGGAGDTAVLQSLGFGPNDAPNRP